MKMSLRVLSLTAGALLAATVALPATYNYASLTSDTLSSGATAGSVSGTLLTATGPVSVTYTGEVNGATQVGAGGTNFFTPASTFTTGTISNAPTNGNQIALTGGSAFTNTITFSSPVTGGVILDLLSLGGPGTSVTYTFNQAFSLLTTGPDQWGGSAATLTQAGNAVTGTEGSGVIFFAGPVSSISFTTTGSEVWNGFEIGTAAATTTPEPTSLLLMGAALVAVPFLRRRKA